MLFKIISFCFQRFREGCRKRQFFFEMSPLLINCVSEVLSYQRVYSGEVFKILLLLQIKPGKCTEMYLKILSTNVKAESDNSLKGSMLCFNQSLITAQCPAQTINNWRSVSHYLLSLSQDSTIALRFATLWNWYHCAPVLIEPIPRRQWKGQLHWWYTISQ